ncbi:hypothetical protein MCAMS1_01105 [biofilm metagenome]
MQIIKDKQIVEDHWTCLPDDAELTGGDITVSAARLQQQGDALFKHQGKLGVRIEPDDNVATISAYLPKLSLIELHFPQMADGRLFSHAWLLRNRYGYSGELRATGFFVPDQVFYLSRVGVNSFYPKRPEALAVTLASLKDFSVNYQPSVN